MESWVAQCEFRIENKKFHLVDHRWLQEDDDGSFLGVHRQPTSYSNVEGPRDIGVQVE